MATEEPAFTLVVDEDAFQVRQYPPLVVAETQVAGDRKQASGDGFRILAGYIFGGNTRRESIAMTAPVSQTAVAGAWVIQFTMPSDKTLDTLPKPDDPRVVLRTTPAIRVAVIRFSGWASDRDFERKRAELERWMAKRGLHAIGPASLAQYNPPWTLGPLRRNEVMLPVDAATSH